MATGNGTVPIINTPASFHFNPVNFDPEVKAPSFSHRAPASDQKPLTPSLPKASPASPDTQAPLGVLSNFKGTFGGKGFNAIFRPNNAGPKNTNFPKDFQEPVAGPPIPQAPNENVLELNFTEETLSFSPPLGNVPNRGLAQQQDLELNGVPYVQVINDVTNPVTGKADGQPTGIHFEPGLWMHVPATTDPVLGETLTRMASIPHGTTINAQGLAPTTSIQGPPTIEPTDLRPFVINSPSTRILFAAQTAATTDTPRLPQNLSAFIAAGTISDKILLDPNEILRQAIAEQKIVKTIQFTVSTDSPDALGGGTANIAFLEGTGGGIEGNSSGPAANADTVTMNATFWVETVEHTIHVPVWSPGQPPIKLLPHGGSIGGTTHAQIKSTSSLTAGVHTPAPPKFEAITPPHAITKPTTIKVHTTQIQYSQIVNLNFQGLTWPHISVATLVPAEPQKIPSNVW